MSPACAGMIPGREFKAIRIRSEPRMRGDDPDTRDIDYFGAGVSPACAGMIPRCREVGETGAREPRMRGDDPGSVLLRLFSIV